MINRRLYTRVNLRNIQAELTCEKGVTGLSRVRDMSLSGIYLEGLANISTDNFCRVRLTGWEKSSISFSGNIVRVDKNGVGLQYSDLDYASCELLRTLMLYHATRPEEVAALFEETCS